MGIQDRDYYRNDGPSIFDSLMPRGLVCRWLIGINIAVFLLQLVGQSAAHGQGQGLITDWLILDTEKVWHGQVWRLVTFAFLHATEPPFFHILFNMLFLWWFGSDLEQLYGRKEFLAVYLVSALLGGAAFMLWSLAQPGTMYCLGASGAVTTLLVLCALHFPRRVIYLFAILPMPIWLFAIFNVAQDAFIFVGGHRTNIAVVVHLAGAAFAVGYFKWQGSIVEVLSGFRWWKNTPPRVRLKVFNPDLDKEEPVAVSAVSTSSASVDEHLEAKLDAILEKIAKSGKDSLTQKEQEVLQQAAQMYKRRRN
jgi:membrane associated rhomboid family serine protease